MAEFLGYIDFPRKDFNTIWGSTFLCIGWALSSEPITSLELLIDGKLVGQLIRDFPRPDVINDHQSFADQPNCGFYGQASAAGFEQGNHQIAVVAKTSKCAFTMGPKEFVYRPDLFAKKRKKIFNILVCPFCKKDLEQKELQLRCTFCGRIFPLIYQTPFFVSKPELATNPKTTPTSPYGESARKIVEMCKDGLVLDCGAGYPLEQYENVFQIDIEKYPSTDVVTNALRLPFRDETFDGVISQSVVEHVQNPFRYVREIERVLKKGGHVVVDSAFLQPMHAYPHHYFNTSIRGLRYLFRSFDHIASRVAEYQLPWYTLRWVLNSYLEGITDPNQRTHFLKISVEEAMRVLNKETNKYPFHPLQDKSVQELACGVHFIGRKK